MESIANEFFLYLSCNTDFEDLSEKFDRLTSNSERMDFVYNLLQVFGFLPKIKLEKKKNSQLAEQVRKEGNQLFECRHYEEALLKYNESINYAPLDSAELGLAYANRSAVLFHRKWYKECLKDIEYAFASKYPPNRKDKLLKRRKDAKLMLKKGKHFSRYEGIPTVDYGPHPRIKCAGNCVEVKCDDVFGKHVVATKNINIGDVVVVEEPFVKVLLQDQYLTHCYHCLKPSANLVPCLSCPLVMFCNEQCRNASWSYHKFECPILELLLDVANVYILNALRIAIKIKELPRNKKTMSVVDYSEVHAFAGRHLKTPYKLSITAVSAALTYHAVLISGGLKNRDENIFKELLFLHSATANKHIIPLYEYNLTEDCTNIIGCGIFPFLSLINHSCNPNLYYIDYGNCLAAVAIQPIRKGKQLFICYVAPYYVQDRLFRHILLELNYEFKCTCNACVYHWPLVELLPLGNPSFQSIISFLAITEDAKLAKYILSQIHKQFRGVEEVPKPIQGNIALQMCIVLCHKFLGNRRLSY